MKNTIIGFLFASLFFLIIAADIQAPRLRFGTAMISDSSGQPYITTNKGLVVNGALVAVDTLQTTGLFQAESIEMPGLSGTITFGGYDSYIQEAVDELNFYSDGFNFSTSSGAAALLTLDSADGIGYHPKRNDASWTGNLLRTKFIRGVSPTGNSTVTYAHGITDGRIIDMRCWLRHDTTATSAYHTARNWYVHPNATYDPTLTYYAGYDSLYVWARFPVGSTATRGDSLYFLLTYFD